MAPSAVEINLDKYCQYVDTDELRSSFALAMSAMYKKEVPLYGDLLRIVRTINEDTLAKSSDPRVIAIRNGDVASERLDLERHGAIRLGTPYELRTVRRIFKVIGLYPVGYYDLSVAGLPMHATCFRPTTTSALQKNPFRVFTTLLRPELLKDVGSRKLAMKLLNNRNIFSAELLGLLDAVDRQNGRLQIRQMDIFIRESMKTFGWRAIAGSTKEDYLALKAEHPILADIACFQSSHINHLTPRTLDISAAQERMKAEGMAVKERIEGPPARQCPILLRQTSFLALEERIQFLGASDVPADGSHKARFGEIEERGAAVTPEGRKLYDRLLAESMYEISKLPKGHTHVDEDRVMEKVFKQFPDTWEDLRKNKLVYFYFKCASSAKTANIPPSLTLEALISQGILEAVPITYEDFLPLSAAGIFQSNLRSGANQDASTTLSETCADKAGYEMALQRKVIDIDRSYADVQEQSLMACAIELGLPLNTFSN